MAEQWKSISLLDKLFSLAERCPTKGKQLLTSKTIILTQNNKFPVLLKFVERRGTLASLIPLAFHISNKRVSISLNWLHNGLAIAQSMPITAKVMTIWLLTEKRACGDPVFPYS